MTTRVLDPTVSDQLIAQRQAEGRDRYDEVWNGEYVIMPLADLQHQDLASWLVHIFRLVWDDMDRGKTYAGANVSGDAEDWTQNYRIPDVLSLTKDTKAIDCGTHLLGGPETAVEIVSVGEDPPAKFDFYASVGVRNLLVIERNPWRVTLYANAVAGQPLRPAATSGVDNSDWITLNILPVQIRVDVAAGRLRIRCDDPAMTRDWSYQS